MSSSDLTASGISPKRRHESSISGPSISGRLTIKQPYLSLMVFLVLSLAAGLRIYDLGAESFSYDEGIMMEATSGGWETVIENVTRGRPPLIVLLGFGWIQLFGESEFAVRLLPAIMGIFSIFLLFRIGQVLANDYVGLVSALIMSVSAFHLFHSQDYRYYSLLTLMTLLSFYFYLKCIDAQGSQVEKNSSPPNSLPSSPPITSSWNHWVCYVLFSASVYYAHYQGVFVLVAQGLFFLTIWFYVGNQLRLRWFLSQLAIGLVLAPSFLKVLLDFIAGSGDGDFQGTIGALGNLGPLSDPPFWLPFHTLFIKFQFISIDNLFQWPYLLAIFSLLALGVAVARWQNSPTSRVGIFEGPSSSMVAIPLPLGFDTLRYSTSGGADIGVGSINRTKWCLRGLLLGLWALCPVFIPFILSKFLSPMYLPRYTISALPAVCILLALILVQWRRRLPLWASLGALLILAMPGLTTYYVEDFKDQWRTAAEYVQSQMAVDKQPEHQARPVQRRTVQRRPVQRRPVQRRAVQEHLAFVSVNNETADRIQLLFGRYLGPESSSTNGRTSLVASSCTISAGIAPPDDLAPQFEECFARRLTNGFTSGIEGEDRLWMITRTAKEGPQLQVEERVLSSIPLGWRQINEERFSGVVVRVYMRSSE